MRIQTPVSMFAISMFAGATLMLGGCAATPQDTARSQQAAANDAERLGKALAGLTPGEPMSCIPPRLPSSSLTAVGPKLLYKVSRNLVYVNDTTGGCEGVARDDVLVTRSFGGNGPCKGDIAQTVTRPVQIPTGSCALGDFTPWRAQ